MKKLILALIAASCINIVWADDAENISSTVSTTEVTNPDPENLKANDEIVLNNDLKIIDKTFHEENKEIPFVIDANYPEIAGEKLTANAQKFNKIIYERVQNEIEQFKKYVKSDMQHMATLPDNVKQNTLHIDYDVNVVKTADQVIISIRTATEGFQAGRAHPYHAHQVFNFNLTQGKEIYLSEIFKPRAKYLNIFSKIASKELNEKLEDKWMINDGTKPTLKNFKNWTLQKDGILITFDEYQVAPYVYGAQEVKIPYSELKVLISPKMPIYSCVEGNEKCVG